MARKIRRLAIIPARSGSKRIKFKNIKKFFGKPIINFSIDNAIKSKLFNKIHISTDTIKFKKAIEKNNKLKIDFLRPKNLSSDRTPLIDVIKFVSKKISKSFNFDEVWLIYPCAPLIKPSDLTLASKKYNLTDKKFPMITLRKYDAPIEWSLKKKRGTFIPTNLNKIKLDSKRTETYYYESASFIIYNFKDVISGKNYKKYYGYELPRERAIDIDDISDWKIAEFFYEYQNKKL